MISDLSNIAKYLEQAGFVEQAKEIKNVMAALDGQFVVDPYSIPNVQRNIENQGYVGGDGVAGGYSLLHTPMVGQPADDQRQPWEDDLLDIFRSCDGKEKDVYEDKGDIYSLFQFDEKLEADMAFKALNRHPAHNIHFQSTTPYRIKDMPFWYIGLREYGSDSQNNVDMLAAANGLRGNTVTDDQNAGMFQGLSDSYFYTGYGNLEGAYGPERR